MTDYDPAEAAAALHAKRQRRERVTPLPPAIAPKTEAEGAAVQRALARLTGAEPPGGFKIAGYRPMPPFQADTLTLVAPLNSNDPGVLVPSQDDDEHVPDQSVRLEVQVLPTPDPLAHRKPPALNEVATNVPSVISAPA